MTQYDIWIDQLPGIGGGMILRLRAALGGDPSFAEIIYKMAPSARKELIERAFPGAGERERHAALQAVKAMNGAGTLTPAECERVLKEKEIRFAAYDDGEYPARLRHIDDPPFGLYYLGELPSAFRPSAAIIGTRLATAYGRDQARIFGRELAGAGVQVISGMARGVDGIAGRGALDADGLSYAVLGCGVDICYPQENADLYGALCERGGVISEYPPGTPPQKTLFPSRNRIISALSDVVLVIEAREKSGTMITVDRALEYGIDVFALPGRVTDRSSRGCNQLIRQGAGMATCPQDILDCLFGEGSTGRDRVRRGRPQSERKGHAGQMSLELSVPPGNAAQPLPDGEGDTARCAGNAERPELRGIERAVYEALDLSTPMGTDDILPAVREQMHRAVSVREIMRTFTLLSVRGLVQEVRAGRYISRPGGNG